MKKEEKTLQDHLVLIEWLFLIGFVIMILPVFFTSDLWTGIFLFLGFGIMVAACIYSNKYFKCPYCEAKLDPRTKVPHFCPNCGKELN